MKIFQWRYGLWLLPLVFWLSLNNAQAALTVTCTANMSNVNLGAITSTNAESARTTATLSYSCTNTGNTKGQISVCLAANGGAHDEDDITPRYMLSKTGEKDLAFNMTLPGGILWGDRLEGKGTEYHSGSLSIPAGPNSTVSGQVTITISLASEEKNSQATQGLHTNNFSGISTALTVDTSTDSRVPNCLKGETQGTTRFPFIVQANFTTGCLISATSNINLESPSANASINGTGRIGVTCHNDTSYNIGLSPLSGNSNGNGTGIMSGNIGNPDKIPYQLRSEVGLNGKPWGNNGATYATLTNGVIGKGSGTEQSHSVHLTVPSVNVRPDTYSDVVTVTVYY